MSSPAPLPVEIHLAVKRGELQKVIKWLRKGGLIDAAHCGTTVDGQASTFAMLHTATVSGNLEMVRMLLKQGADVDLPSSLGMTALMAAAGDGQLSCLFVLLQHSANPDLQDCQGFTPLEVQEEAERAAKQEAAAEAARLAAVERVREAAPRDVVRDVVRVRARAAAVSKAREEAVAAAAAAAAAVAAAAEAAAVAAAKTEALERAMAEDGEGGSSGVAGPSGASEAAEAPDDYVCPITAEIMTDPVSTSDGFTYERAAISEWLLTKDTSPSTGAKLESKKVIPNLSLRSMIRSFGEDRAEAALRAAIASGGLSRARGTRGLV